MHVIAVAQSHKSCSAAFLLDPCYRAEVKFKAPYAVTSPFLGSIVLRLH